MIKHDYIQETISYNNLWKHKIIEFEYNIKIQYFVKIVEMWIR